MFETTLDRKALTEVYSIIKLLEEDNLKKIPPNIVDAIRYNMDLKYEVDYSKLMGNELLEDTKKILSVLYIDYLASYEERNIIYRMENLKFAQNDDIFLNSKSKNIKYNTLNENNNQELIEIKNESLIKKIISRLKNLFERRK